MDNNTQTETNTVQTETNAPVSGNDGKSERLFTQDEVNRIVSERVARIKAEKQPPVEDEREKALREREEALTARENRNACIDFLKGLEIDEKRHSVFLDALDTNNVEAFKKAATAFSEHYKVTVTKTGATVAHPPVNAVKYNDIDRKIDEAFKIPKKF